MKKFSLDSKISDVVADERAREIIEDYLPGQLKHPMFQMIAGLKAKNLVGKGNFVGLSLDLEKELYSKILDLE